MLTPIMRRSLSIYQKERSDVFHFSATIESEEETRAWLPQAYEHEEWPEGLGSSASQGAGPFDRLGLFTYRVDFARTLASLVFPKQGRSSHSMTVSGHNRASDAWVE